MNFSDRPTSVSPGISNRPDLSVVLYCHNDALTVESQLRQWMSVLSEEQVSYEIIVCNAGSIDGTGRILDNLRREQPQIRVLHQLRIGISRSIRRGYEAARGTFVLQSMGTGQNDPEDFRQMWRKRNSYDLLLGDRRHRLDGWLRPLLSYGLRRTLKVLFRVQIEDANVPFRLFRRSVVLAILNSLPRNLESTQVFMGLILKKTQPERVLDIPIPYRLPPKGKVRGSFPKLMGLGLQMFFELVHLRLFFGRMRRILSPSLAHS